MIPRVDVFSAKGGVGKTTLSILLARARVAPGRSVLLVDADLTGTCLGDVLAPGFDWENAPTLTHLVAGAPEALPDMGPLDRLPVYRLPTPADRDVRDLRPSAGVPGGRLLFCPSVAEAMDDGRPLDPSLVHALLAHESAGGWVHHVIGQVIEETRRRVPDLGAVVVDHGPGLGPFQWATLHRILREGAPAPGARRWWWALLVTSRDKVDLVAAERVVNRLPSMDAVVGVANLVPVGWGANWQQTVRGHAPTDAWNLGLVPLWEDHQMAVAYAKGRGATLTYRPDGQSDAIPALAERLFGD